MIKFSLAGLETEYGLTASPRQHEEACQQVVMAACDTAKDEFAISTVPARTEAAAFDRMLSNGARLYIDLGHPEYSTPIVQTAEELVAADETGAALLVRAAERVRQGHPELGRIDIYKSSADRVGNSCGCHENYLIMPRLFKELTEYGPAAARFWAPFLVTRIIYSGTGRVCGEGPGGTIFELSPRARFIRRRTGLDTVTDRALINTRDRPYADPQQFRRLHVIAGEANRSPFSTFLKIGVSQLILTMLEQGALEGDFSLKDPVGSLKQVSRDPGAALAMTDGRSTSALEIQNAFLEAADHFVAGQQLAPFFGRVVRLWRESLEDLEQYPKVPVRSLQRLDWLIKYRLVLKTMKAYSLEWGDARLADLDDRYHRLGEDDLFQKLVQLGQVEAWLPAQSGEDLCRFPPSTTRAATRGDEIRSCCDRIAWASWDVLVYKDGHRKELSDPYVFSA